MNLLNVVQIIIAVLLIGAILLQQRGGGLGGAFGGDSGGFHSARGLQKKLYWASVALGILFVVLALANLVV